MTDRRYVGSAFTGHGASLVGARWNAKGRKVVYCASSRSNAVLEVSFSFHNPSPELWQRFVLIPIDVPDEVSRETIRLSGLPTNWAALPDATQTIGEEWLVAERTCLLRIPSILIPGEANYLINPFHPDFELVLVRPVQAYESFDEFVAGEREFQERAVKSRIDPLGPRDLFLCHSPKDRIEVVEPLRQALMDFGISCWVTFAEITVGDSIIQKINEGLTKSTYVLLVISPSFLTDPETSQQTKAALHRETREKRKLVLPMVVNYSDQMVDVAAALPLFPDKQTYVWQGDAYAAAKQIVRSVQGR